MSANEPIPVVSYAAFRAMTTMLRKRAYDLRHPNHGPVDPRDAAYVLESYADWIEHATDELRASVPAYSQEVQIE